jgi:hypothetical protein
MREHLKEMNPLNDSWLTRSLFTCPPRLARVLKVGGLLVLMLGIIFPTLVTLAWHLRHGNMIKCRGKAVFVPLRWIADINEANDATLTKLPLVIFSKPGATPLEGTIFVGQSLSTPGENIDELYKRWERMFWNLHSDLGEVVSGPVKMGSGPREAFCMQGADPRTARSSASCLILGGRWTADFWGNKKDLEEFFAIIRKLD